MFTTLNETHLHKALKTLYKEEYGGDFEVETEGFVTDILCPDGTAIEIQTGNLGHLEKKIKHFITHKKNIRIVYPLVISKYIETENETTGKKTKRKSPVRKTQLSIFKELTKLTPYLLSRYFFLDIVEVVITETRTDSGFLMQSKNNQRRFKKTWNKTGKKLEEIKSRFTLHGKKSWKKLIPKNLPKDFCVKDLLKEFKKTDRKNSEQEVRLMVWCYLKMKLIKFIKTEKRIKYYSVRAN